MEPQLPSPWWQQLHKFRCSNAATYAAGSPPPPPEKGVGGVWHVAFVCCSRLQLAYWPIAIRCLFLGPFTFIDGGANRPLTTVCPSSSSLPYLPLSASLSFLSLGQLCQRSPRTFPVSLLCVGSTQKRAIILAGGQVRPSGHPKPAVRDPSPTAAFGPWDVHLCGLFPWGHIT